MRPAGPGFWVFPILVALLVCPGVIPDARAAPSLRSHSNVVVEITGIDRTGSTPNYQVRILEVIGPSGFRAGGLVNVTMHPEGHRDVGDIVGGDLSHMCDEWREYNGIYGVHETSYPAVVTWYTVTAIVEGFDENSCTPLRIRVLAANRTDACIQPGSTISAVQIPYEMSFRPGDVIAGNLTRQGDGTGDWYCLYDSGLAPEGPPDEPESLLGQAMAPAFVVVASAMTVAFLFVRRRRRMDR